jgi:hypothetical protein
MSVITLTEDQFAVLQTTLIEAKKAISWIETILLCATFQEVEPENPEVEPGIN